MGDHSPPPRTKINNHWTKPPIPLHTFMVCIGKLLSSSTEILIDARRYVYAIINTVKMSQTLSNLENFHLWNYKKLKKLKEKFLKCVPNFSLWKWKNETKVMEDCCWAITQAVAQSHSGQSVPGCQSLDFSWTPFYIHTQLSTYKLDSDLHEIWLAPDFLNHNYCLSWGLVCIVTSHNPGAEHNHVNMVKFIYVGEYVNKPNSH